jgi:adenylate kinase
VYRQETAPVLDHYRAAGTRIDAINGVGDIDAITDRIMAALRHNSAVVGTA